MEGLKQLLVESSATSQASMPGHDNEYINSIRDDDIRKRAKDALRELVATASRDLSTEQFTRLNNDINKRIFELCSSSDDKLGGVMAIEALIDLNAEENTKLTRFANYLRLVLPTNDVTTMIAASKALGSAHISLA